MGLPYDNKAFREDVRKSVRRGHMGSEDTDPPPRNTVTSVTEIVVQQADKASKVLGGFKVVGAICVGILSCYTWATTRVGEKQLNDVATACTNANAKTQADLLETRVGLSAKIDEVRAAVIKDHQETGDNFNKMDRFFLRNFQDSFMTPPPTVGPDAKKHGRQ